jgi:hypothetical protein
MRHCISNCSIVYLLFFLTLSSCIFAFTQANLAGEWFLGGSDLQGAHTWDGMVTLDNSGAVTGGVLRGSDGPEYSFTDGSFSINPTGQINGTLVDSDGITTVLTMQMDGNKGIMAGEGNATGNEDGVFIFVKTSSGFTQANLAGEWFLGGSDLQGAHTWDGMVTLDNSGVVTGGILRGSDGPEYSFTDGSFSINPTGQINGTLVDSDGVTTVLTMQVDGNKGIMAGEGNAIGNEDGVFIFVKKIIRCVSPLNSDLNNDCKVDINDFAVMASEWLGCGLDPISACWE